MLSLPRLLFRAGLLIALLVVMIVTVSFWLAGQRAGWQEVAWHLPSDGAPALKVLQGELDRETKANPNLPGQMLYVRAPSLGLDQTLVAGPGLQPSDDVRVASNTKPFVAAMVMKLVEAEKLRLDAPIGPYLSPKVRAILSEQNYQLDTITLRQLLNHTSGIPDYASVLPFRILTFGPNVLGFAPHWTAEQEIWFAARFGDLGRPGEQFGYADTNYLLAADIIKQAAGHPTIGQAARRMLNWPALGADETYWEAMEPVPAGTRRATQWRGLLDDTGLDVSYDQYGGGGLVMSMDDLGRATRAIVRGEVFKNPVSMAGIMQTPGPDGNAGGYGLGIQPVKLHGEVCWGHGGFWGTSAFHCPRLDITIARSVGQTNAMQGYREGFGPLSHVILLAQAAERTRASPTNK
ncbi:D-alanyl-D-alanine carboxypeptidase [Candidatus Phycosocius bacilliformis]|uniref:D-alanyl-D-alanine carboxypeptidase n=1 Tax=Candidatus Phycosocius bacilliformis TaxID=1445552 RepID=A0A2P2EE71_9PROT|nr:serine hydrolase domain-containing protein [Candidatus Phycosocius bacilliformis]GBF59345.1 D-alanyl-D-alanine carboxypeptidase [Candidatus Phycosocius bacilliformis]